PVDHKSLRHVQNPKQEQPFTQGSCSMKKPFHLMAKPTSYQCNLDCDYCFYLEKERFFNKKAEGRGKEKITHMSDEVLKSYVKHYIAGQDSPIVEFAWLDWTFLSELLSTSNNMPTARKL
ncbi:hypothetical protein, partial [Endozoicomonas numazuensis]